MKDKVSLLMEENAELKKEYEGLKYAHKSLLDRNSIIEHELQVEKINNKALREENIELLRKIKALLEEDVKALKKVKEGMI